MLAVKIMVLGCFAVVFISFYYYLSSYFGGDGIIDTPLLFAITSRKIFSQEAAFSRIKIRFCISPNSRETLDFNYLDNYIQVLRALYNPLS